MVTGLPETVLCWRWRPAPGYRSTFGPESVNILQAMVARHYPVPHRFVCITDDPRGLDPSIEVVPLRDDFAHLTNPAGRRHPSCYRRLRAFSAEFSAIVGRRFVSLDLDCVIVGDLVALWDRPEEFVIWGDTNPRTHYNASMYLLTTGARSRVWETFNPDSSPRKTFAAGQFGTDQAWISYVLGPGEARFSMLDGVYSYRNEIKPMGGRLPADARAVIFHGQIDPDSPEAQQLDWVREHYRVGALTV